MDLNVRDLGYGEGRLRQPLGNRARETPAREVRMDPIAELQPVRRDPSVQTAASDNAPKLEHAEHHIPPADHSSSRSASIARRSSIGKGSFAAQAIHGRKTSRLAATAHANASASSTSQRRINSSPGPSIRSGRIGGRFCIYARYAQLEFGEPSRADTLSGHTAYRRRSQLAPEWVGIEAPATLSI